MIMPIDIDKKEFSRDKRGYNSREVDEFLDLVVVDYEKVLNDNRSMAHKIKSLEKQLEEAQKSDTAMVETLETAKKLMADISASAERRAELMMRDAELEAENMMLEAKSAVRKLNEEHSILKGKVERLRANYKNMLKTELGKLDEDQYELNMDLDLSDIEGFEAPVEETANISKAPTIVVTETKEETNAVELDDLFAIEEEFTAPAPEATTSIPVEEMGQATISDLSESLKKMAAEPVSLNDTIILK